MKSWLRKVLDLPIDLKIQKGVGILSKLSISSLLVCLSFLAVMFLGFKTYRGLALQTNQFSTLEALLIEFRMSALKYLSENNDQILKDIEAIKLSFSEEFQKSKEGLDSSDETLKILTQQEDRLTQYHQSFLDLVQIIKNQKDITGLKFREYQEGIEINLKKMIRQSSKSNKDVYDYLNQAYPTLILMNGYMKSM